MKNYSFLLFFLVLIISVSCERETDTEPTDDRSKFTGTWNCEENSSVFGNSVYEVDIYKHTSNENQVVIDNFYNLGYDKNVSANIDGNLINIPQQQIGDYKVSGSGILEDGEIKLDYTADDGGDVDEVEATYRK